MLLTDELLAKADANGIVLYEGTTRTIRNDGIHLLNPSTEELRLAVDDAVQSKKTQVYVYKGEHFAGA